MLDTTTFVGLDVHARSIKAVSLDVMTGEVRCATFGYDAGAVAAWVRSVDPRARCVYESGVTGFDLQKRLSGLGVDCVVGAVSKMIKPSADRRRKNDRNDAEFLARMLSVGNVVEVWVPDDECEAARDLTRALEDARDEPLALEAAALQVPAQARARLRREDAHRPQEGELDPGALVLDRVDKVRGGGRRGGAGLLRRGGQAGGGGEVEARGASSGPRPASPGGGGGSTPCAASRASTPRPPPTSCSRPASSPGSGTPARSAAWVGLTPSEHSSGENDRRGAITKAGNKHLRKTLVEAAWHYLTCSGRPKDLAKGQAPDPAARRHAAKGVRRLVERREALLARGVHGNKANVATARELACWVWAVGLMAEEA